MEQGPDYQITLAELERDAHVPVEQQVTELAQEPGEGPVSPAKLNLLRAVSILHDGRW
jgi:hypothetical protein